MKALLIVFIQAMSTVLFSTQSTPAFRALLATDTKGENIQLTTTSDLEHMKKSLYSIANQLQLKLYIQVLKGAKCSVHLIKKSINALEGNSNDILLLYYSGHGDMDPRSSPWPVMCPSGGLQRRGLLGSSIVKFLQKNHHRLTILLLDCCNSTAFLGPSTSVFKEKFAIETNERLPGLRHLFLESQGLIVGCGARQGEEGICIREIGSIFTNGILNVLKVVGKSNNASWEDIFPSVMHFCHNYYKNHPQHPVWQHLP